MKSLIDPVTVSDPFGDRTEFLNDTYPREDHQDVIGDVYFPPVKALAGRYGVVMMVVMPAFPQCDECQYRVVTACIRRVVAPAAEHVVQRVDRQGPV